MSGLWNSQFCLSQMFKCISHILAFTQMYLLTFVFLTIRVSQFYQIPVLSFPVLSRTPSLMFLVWSVSVLRRYQSELLFTFYLWKNHSKYLTFFHFIKVNCWQLWELKPNVHNTQWFFSILSIQLRPIFWSNSRKFWG